jgi:hypothetical protein
MAAKKKAEAATGTVQARHAAEKARQAAARAERDTIAAELEADHAATAAFIASKPTDSRTMDRAQPTQ